MKVTSIRQLIIQAEDEKREMARRRYRRKNHRCSNRNGERTCQRCLRATYNRGGLCDACLNAGCTPDPLARVRRLVAGASNVYATKGVQS